MAYRLEYSQRRNGRHVAWIEIDTFATFDEARVASGHLTITGDNGEDTVWMLGREQRDRIVRGEG
jgi:hypothetical protein